MYNASVKLFWVSYRKTAAYEVIIFNRSRPPLWARMSVDASDSFDKLPDNFVIKA